MMMPKCVPPASVIAWLYALSTYQRLTVHDFKFHNPSSNLITALPLCSLCRFRRISSALLSTPRSAVLLSLTFSWDPGLLMTFLRFVSRLSRSRLWLIIWHQHLVSETSDMHVRVRTPTVLTQIPCDDIKKQLHAREWRKEQARPLQMEVGLVWNIDVLWDLWGAKREIYKLLPPVAMFTFYSGVTLFWFKAVSENKKN